MKALLEKMCPVHEEPDLLGARWSKLLINATFSGLGTVVGGRFGDVSENRDARKVAVRCMKECIDVGHAAGITFAPVQGKDITKLFYYRGAAKRAFATLLLPIAMKKHREIEPSMLQDLRNGKPCEVLILPLFHRSALFSLSLSGSDATIIWYAVIDAPFSSENIFQLKCGDVLSIAMGESRFSHFNSPTVIRFAAELW